MNHIYRVIFNHALGVWQSVSEKAKARGKSSSKAIKAVVMAVAVASSSVAVANPNLVEINQDTSFRNQNQTYGNDVDGVVIAPEKSNTVTVSLNAQTLQHTAVGTQQEPKGIIVGSRGQATINANASKIDIADTLVLGESSNSDTRNSRGEIHLVAASELTVGNLLEVGHNGEGQIDVYSGGKIQANEIILSSPDHYGVAQNDITGIINAHSQSSVNATERIIIGETGKARIYLDNSSLTTNTLKLGEDEKLANDGQGKQKTIFGDGLLSTLSSKIQANQVFIGGEGRGEISLQEDSRLEADNIFVGGNGHENVKTDSSKVNAQLTITNSIVQTGSLSRGNGNNLGKSRIDLINGKIISTQDMVLFDKFSNSDYIFLGTGIDNSNGATFDTNGFNVSIAPTAVLQTYNNSFNKHSVRGRHGGLIKEGVGTLTINSNSIKDLRADLAVNAGTLKIDGDYAINDNQTLYMGIKNEADYAKLLVTGKLDITQGKLAVSASDLIKQLITSQSTTAEWKDVVKAGTLIGEFNDFVVLDNKGNEINSSRIEELYDNNSLHLVVKANSIPPTPVTPTPVTPTPVTPTPVTPTPVTPTPVTPTPVTPTPVTPTPVTPTPVTPTPVTPTPVTPTPVTPTPVTPTPVTPTPVLLQ
ncbi:autotransporter outer membrane beta-barrel domain-containing protein [Moraxella sp. ZY210820]|uniref:ESPR domain-containing protein n=1 Tax=Moraxella sp. ZY210820 TaxID=2904123 RepID=UPI0027315D56|nr:autotransporter outer membrane beta-barrel domain-containing protein [Moraxella sp. ZY210820]WLF83176.1 ESPR domain-containing protein [Moraxella sp. ZY210820]